MARDKEAKDRPLPGFGKDSAATTPGEEETGVVSETVPSPPSWHVWEYDPVENRTVYRGEVVTRQIPGETIYYLTPEQHHAYSNQDGTYVELVKKDK